MSSKKISMVSASGKKVFPFELTADQVDLFSVARHLACQPRWLGATQHPSEPNRIFYSVAEHSVYVSDYVEKRLNRPDLALDALLHDAPEAYSGDMIRPLKYSPSFHKPYKNFEARIETAVGAKFDISFPLDSLVKLADDAVCLAEWHQIVPFDRNETWDRSPVSGVTDDQMADIEIQMLLPMEAYRFFMGRYFQLSSDDRFRKEAS